jgi:hypothetical protein
MSTPVKKEAGAGTAAPFNYLVLLDIVVVGCILVVAGRPDGLAITATAIIVAACALVYRGYLGIRTSMTRPRAPAPEVDHKFKPATYHVEETTAPAKPRQSASWLRDGDA